MIWTDEQRALRETPVSSYAGRSSRTCRNPSCPPDCWATHH